jgi:hypothetical protein
MNIDHLLRPHQKEAVAKLKSGNILWGVVGAGKSRVALAWYIANENGENIVVITSAKKRDSLEWEKEAAAFNIYKQVTIDSWNNIHKYVDHKNTFFIFDEQRLIGSGVWVKSFLKIVRNGNPWLLLSATPGDTWLDYIPVFIANGFYRNRTEFKREHVIYNTYAKFPKVERYVGEAKLIKLRNKILVKMPYEWHTERHSIDVWVDHDKAAVKQVEKQRWNLYKDQPIRDVTEYFRVQRQIVNSDPSRLEAVWDILKRHRKLIIFYTFNFELKLLRSFSDHIVFAEWNGHRHEDLPEGKTWMYVVQYSAGSEGWNCITTDTVVFWSLPYSYRQWEQAHGRIDRMTTIYRHLYYYVLRSRASIDFSIWKTLQAKKNFQPSQYDKTFKTHLNAKLAK